MIPKRFAFLAAPIALALSTLAAAAGPANAAPRHFRAPHRHFRAPHHHLIPVVTGSAPGDELQPLSLPAPSYQVSTDAQLSAALQSAQPGQVIHLASGATFSHIVDTKARTGWVTLSGAGDSQAPVIAGAHIEGGQFLRFTNVLFTQRLYVSYGPVLRYARPAENIQVLNSEFDCGATQTVGGGQAILVRQGSQNVTFSGDYIHDCTVGFASVSQDNQSSNIVLTHDTFQDFYGDAIDLGGLQNVVISDDVIADICHSAGMPYHDDGIQFFGNDTNVAITNNVIANSLDQLLFIQDAVAGTNTGSSVNSNILVENNLMYGDAAFAVQAQGALQTRFIDNTIWDNGDGSLLLRKSGYTKIAPTDTVVTGNVLESYGTSGVTPATEGDNLIEHVSRSFSPGPGDIIGKPAQFVSETTGDFQLAPGSIGTSGVTVATGTAIGVGTSTTGSSGASGSANTTVTPATTLGSSLPAESATGWGAPQWGM
jgi:hypothetical protein